MGLTASLPFTLSNVGGLATDYELSERDRSFGPTALTRGRGEWLYRATEGVSLPTNAVPGEGQEPRLACRGMGRCQRSAADPAHGTLRRVLYPSTARQQRSRGLVGGGGDPFWFLIGWTFFWQAAGEICYSIYGDVPWLLVATAAGVVTPGGSLPIVVTLDASALAPGNYAATTSWN